MRIRDWLTIGGEDLCDSCREGGCIHIYRDDLPDLNCGFHEHQGDFCLEHKDGQEISVRTLRTLAISLVSFVTEFNSVLIHCDTGECRSPTIGIFALSLIENRHPIDVLPDIYMPMWKEGRFPNICMTPLRNIVEWYDRR